MELREDTALHGKPTSELQDIRAHTVLPAIRSKWTRPPQTQPSKQDLPTQEEWKA